VHDGLAEQRVAARATVLRRMRRIRNAPPACLNPPKTLLRAGTIEY